MSSHDSPTPRCLGSVSVAIAAMYMSGLGVVRTAPREGAPGNESALSKEYPVLSFTPYHAAACYLQV
jgi:hypothetical protein